MHAFLQGAKESLLKAGRGDLAVQLCVKKGQWAAAIRLCSTRTPEMLNDLLGQHGKHMKEIKTSLQLAEVCDVGLTLRVGDMLACRHIIRRKLRFHGQCFKVFKSKCSVFRLWKARAFSTKPLNAVFSLMKV